LFDFAPSMLQVIGLDKQSQGGKNYDLRDAIKQIEGIKLIQQEQQKKYFFNDTKPPKGTAESSFVTDGKRSIQNIDLTRLSCGSGESLAFGCSGLPVYILSGPVVFGVE
jgi:hypothetical protein